MSQRTCHGRASKVLECYSQSAIMSVTPVMSFVLLLWHVFARVTEHLGSSLYTLVPSITFSHNSGGKHPPTVTVWGA